MKKIRQRHARQRHESVSRTPCSLPQAKRIAYWREAPTTMPRSMSNRSYITTPIYYVNDRPHIGHVYSTTIADCMARHSRLQGRETFFLTGTDEHATKVVDAAAERGLSTQAWADQNAEAFESTFRKLGLSFNDFIRTSQDRHKTRVTHYVQRLMDSGDVYLGEYEGWYDAGQEEYVTEGKAKEQDYKSAINGKPLVKKTEKNWFFRLSRYQDDLLTLLEKKEAVHGQSFVVEPAARCNEIIGRIKEGLNDVPMSRSGMSDWGIEIPGSDGSDAGRQTIYVWIDALFNYLSTVDTDDRRAFWNDAEIVHITAKDILWFHAAIWPALLLALGEKLPHKLYAHSFWISEGQKMSKSLGNFIDLEKIDHYVETFGLDALRWFLITQGPMGTTDSDFAEAKFIEHYNGDLANNFSNCFNRVANMTAKYFEGTLPAPQAQVAACDHLPAEAAKALAAVKEAASATQPGKAAEAALVLVDAINKLIEVTAPFKLAKDESKLPEVGTILYHCAEAMRIASVLLWPVLPSTCQTIWERMGLHYATDIEAGKGNLDTWATWGGFKGSETLEKGNPLFMRYRAE